MITRTLLPILLVIGAIMMYVTYIKPQLVEIDAVEAEIETLDKALKDADEVELFINKLAEEKASISARDEERLAQILPRIEDVDPVSLVNDINNIAMSHGFILSAVDYTFTETDIQTQGGSTIGAIEFKFTISASYESFIRFLRSIESSEQLYDVTVTSFTVPSSVLYNYSVTLKKYILQ